MDTILSSVWATITKCHSLGDLDNRNLFLTTLVIEKSKIEAPAGSVSGECPEGQGISSGPFL